MSGHPSRFVGLLKTASIAAAAAVWGTVAWADDAGDPARVRRAIAALDARQDAWSQFARAQRGEGASRTVCVSCHTGVSYALARPVLGQFTASTERSASEERLIGAVELRTARWDELDSPRFRLMYDSNERKKAQSRGTEAVINALILARDDATRARSEPAASTRAALQHLWKTQSKDGSEAGSWDWLDFGLEPWEADGSRVFGTALAAMAVGAAPGYRDGELDDEAARGLMLLREYLRRRFADESAYHRLWILEASRSMPGLLSPDQKRAVIEQLVSLRRDDGGWALATLGPFERVDGSAQDQTSDGYATGLVLHVLLSSGTPATRPEVERGLAWLRSHQQADGSWPGRSVNKQRDPATFVGKLMSDAATALAALALAEAGSR